MTATPSWGGLLLLGVLPSTLSAQIPDSVAVSDTIAGVVVTDTAQAENPPVFYRLPWMGTGDPTSLEAGVWSWTRRDLQETPAQTLLELLDRIPGVLPLKGGDYGTPEAASAFGIGGGRVRVYWDGFEQIPIDGAVVDLAQIGLGGLDRVRVERGLGEIRIELESLEPNDVRPLSTVEAGTGDLDTNHFRGTFLHPRAIGGSLGLTLERLDTRGARGEAAGSRSGGWVRYALHRGNQGGIAVELRQITAKSELDSIFPESSTRSELIVRARHRIGSHVALDAFYGRSALEADGYGEVEDLDEMRSQTGIRAVLRAGDWWARSQARFRDGPELPSNSLEFEGGRAWPGVVGAAARWSRDDWEGRTTSSVDVRAWTEPIFGISFFGAYSEGERGARDLTPVEEMEPDTLPDQEPQTTAPFHVTDRTAYRIGASIRQGPLYVSAARLRLETDSLAPFDLATDRFGVVVPGLDVSGLEVTSRIGLPWLPGSGFGLYGSLVKWDEEARYMPELMYRAGIDFHQKFLDSGNFELWAEVGIRGRDSMLLPFFEEADPESEDPPGLQSVDFYQSWDAFLQMRITTFSLYFRFENITIRENLQDFPGLIQPFTRATYGVRWNLWN